jgi:uncharacterized membrane protein YqiK
MLQWLMVAGVVLGVLVLLVLWSLLVIAGRAERAMEREAAGLMPEINHET